MTVIAYKDGVMAADMQVTVGSQRYRTQKLVRLPCGGVAGGAGDSAAAEAALAWFKGGGSLSGPGSADALPDVEGASVLIVKGDGTRWILWDRFPAWEVLDPEIAIGCGADGARVLMARGLSAVEACLQMAVTDVYCSDPVQSMAVETPHEFAGVLTYVAKAAKPAAKKTAKRRK